MNSTTEHETFLRSGNKERTRVGWGPLMRRLSLAWALMLATVASGQAFRVLKSFTGTDGGWPAADLVLAGNTLYGTTEGGGSSGQGVVFKINTDGSGYAVLKSFTGSDGYSPQGSLVLAGSTLYGTTCYGGSASSGGQLGAGVVFKVNTDGSGFAVIKNFIGSDGQSPQANLVLAGNTLYGTTQMGGSSLSEGSYGNGVVFKVNTDGSGFAVMKSFTYSDDLEGCNPLAGLVLAGNTLYGTTRSGGASSCGVVFKVNTDGSDFAVLKSFTGVDGGNPVGSLVLGGSTLYGTTEFGGSSIDPTNWGGAGVVFKVNTDGSGYAVLKRFTGIDGNDPFAGLVLAGNTLYGTTYEGGSSIIGGGNSGYGVVFKVNTDGSEFAVLKNFNGGDGLGPYAGLVLAGSTLYGTTYYGAGNGTVFSLTWLSIITPPLSQTAEAGTIVDLRVEAAPPAPGLVYQWIFDETNALASATNVFLELTNVQPAQAGAYTVVVTGLGSSVTSAPALLSVIPPVERRAIPALHLMGSTGSLLHVEYADSLAVPQWTSLSNVTLSGGQQLCFDFSQSLPAQRFYRAWLTNGTQPSLDATMATEIALAGAIGSSVRVDYINAIGPTDAWVTLDAVTLTNTTQPYYDLTAFGQPTRLYRLSALP